MRRCGWCQTPTGGRRKFCRPACAQTHRRLMADRKTASRASRELIEAHLEADALAAIEEGDTDRVQRRSSELRQLRRLEQREAEAKPDDPLAAFDAL